MGLTRAARPLAFRRPFQILLEVLRSPGLGNHCLPVNAERNRAEFATLTQQLFHQPVQFPQGLDSEDASIQHVHRSIRSTLISAALEKRLGGLGHLLREFATRYLTNIRRLCRHPAQAQNVLAVLYVSSCGFFLELAWVQVLRTLSAMHQHCM